MSTQVQEARWALPPLETTGAPPWTWAVGESVRSALAALRAHKLRAALAMVGFVVGISGVLTINAFGQLLQVATRNQNAQLGANLIQVESVPLVTMGVPQPGSGMSFDEDDTRAIRQLPHVVAVTPRLVIQAQVVAGGNNWRTPVWAVGPDIQRMRGYAPAQGTFFSQDDSASGNTVAVIGQTVAKKLFGDANPVGQQVRIGPVQFTVVGMLAPRGSSGDRDEDDIVLVPFSTGQTRLFGAGHAMGAALWVQADQSQNVNGVMAAVQRTLEQRYQVRAGQPGGFTTARNAAAGAMKRTGEIIGGVMVAISAIALAIGAAGIVTIMLASVTERTREIGIRMAVGAQPRDVLLQFLAEAATVSIVGGLLGIAGGYALVWGLVRLIASTMQMRIQVMPTLEAAVMALAIAALVGVVAGLYPARRAARLDPVEALRR